MVVLALSVCLKYTSFVWNNHVLPVKVPGYRNSSVDVDPLSEKLMLSLRSNMLFRMGGMEMSLSTWESGTVVSEILLEKQNVSCIIR